MTTATSSNLEDFTNEDGSIDWDEYYASLDTDLYNDLTSETGGAADDPVVYQLQVMNRLLGLILALMIIIVIFGLIRFIMHIVQDNITNHF